MADSALFYTFSVFTLVALGFTLTSWLLLRRLRDYRTLKLGRRTLLVLAGIFASLNGFLVMFLAYDPGPNTAQTKIFIVELVIVGILPLVLGLVLPIVILVLTIRIFRKEAVSLANFLLPLVMFAFFALSIIDSVANHLPESWVWLKIVSLVFPILATYLAWQFTVFFVSSWVYGRLVRREQADLYVVLGAGLIQGQYVGPLLAKRIQAAIQAANPKTRFVMSGGKGGDEQLSEALAMKNYAVDQGIDPARILEEDQSKNTLENLKFTSQLVTDKFLFFTSDFHVFRAALFAAQLGLPAEGGRGGKTPLYYRIPAFIREFIAVLNSQRKKHILIFCLVIGLDLVIALVSQVLYLITR